MIRFFHFSLFICLYAILPLRGMAQDSTETEYHYNTDQKLHFGFTLDANYYVLKLRQIPGQPFSDSLKGISFHGNTGFGFGLTFDYHLNTFLSIRQITGFMFVQHSLEVDYEDISTTHAITPQTFQIEGNFLSEELDLKLRSRPWHKLEGCLFGGGKLNSMLSVNPNNAPGAVPILIKFNKMDCMLVGGAGVDLLHTYRKLGLELKYCVGMTDLLDHGYSAYASFIQKITSSAIMLSFIIEG